MGGLGAPILSSLSSRREQEAEIASWPAGHSVITEWRSREAEEALLDGRAEGAPLSLRSTLEPLCLFSQEAEAPPLLTPVARSRQPVRAKPRERHCCSVRSPLPAAEPPSFPGLGVVAKTAAPAAAASSSAATRAAALTSFPSNMAKAGCCCRRCNCCYCSPCCCRRRRHDHHHRRCCC